MQKVLSHLMAQFRDFYRTLPPVKRASILVATLIVVGAALILSVMMSGANNSVLFSNVAPDQLPLVIDKLQKKNIPFSMRDNGSTILVPSDLLHATQMSIMAELGNSKIGSTGLEIFDKQDFGVTSYAQKINYQRALQGELMRAINTLSAIKQSKVLLALPTKKTFLEEGGDATASVVVDLHPGKNLTPDQVKGITHLVSSAVEGLDPERVTVVDSRGKVLSKNSGGEAAATGELMELKTKVEKELEERIESMLTRVVGAGKVIAKVNATLNSRNISTLEEIIDPDSTALRSSTTEEELLDGARTNPVGVPGARANLPGAEDQGEVGFRQNVRKELKTNNFAVPKTVKNIKEVAGAVESISVAVLVDGVLQPGKEGEAAPQWAARSPEDLAKYENIVKNAIGFNGKRGDSVTIENIRFQPEDFTESDQILTTLERKKLLHALFKWSLLGMSLAMFFFIVIRPFMRWITDSFQESVEDMLPRTIEELEELQSADNTLPGMSGALPILQESLDPDKAESELLKERIMSMVDQDEEKAAGAFSLWLVRRDT